MSGIARRDVDAHFRQLPGHQTSDVDIFSWCLAVFRAYYVHISPNIMINIYEGVADVNIVVPAGPDKTKVIFDYYFDESMTAMDCDHCERDFAVRVYTQTSWTAKKREAAS